ncbi:DUF3107 domain-containing protein [Corynebacterium sp. ES2794-CONJ1]|uniref:DUF3107 domain-containing protein n=1 Tax=unclassified Corynebacterium TaxID=2624378 RepID=UPI0021675D3D|nr:MULTISPECIES: DUF3107 domain-containing protein [unclassified Corynebacterium]MCS4489466.1 DUF3107 domain-containing protein [Corynebacterium sp. ES2775-CONJ]MCS4491523.1 DUF3107 domain-containing protein [Corynebacterium sp. ES2715-CONJ3]MCS4531377.1 DUF3107 domain-containing protein [Corynebacterium sp. ES2730-CONJ]MCU9518764.1 DUF3107 domain-containing protein [Corynebacterium sp. ES2794-CONJ1]
MDIKIGFSDSPRELVITSSQDHDTVVAKISEALHQGTGVLELEDDKQRRYLIRNDRIAYVEIGTQTAHRVGFAGA